MKTFLATILIVAFLASCKSGTSLTKQESIAQMAEKIESGRYTFIPTTAIPMAGKSINLSYSFSLKISKDTISAYLPYYGRAYSAPMSSEEAGINFTSTDFLNLSVFDEKKKTNNVTINIKDNRRKYKLSLQIGENGYATLNVQDNDRQAISFNGRVE